MHENDFDYYTSMKSGYLCDLSKSCGSQSCMRAVKLSGSGMSSRSMRGREEEEELSVALSSALSTRG
jgi:hypothetical protein